MGSYAGVLLGSENCSTQYGLLGKVDVCCGGNFPDDTGLLVVNISSVWRAAKKFLRLSDWVIKWQIKFKMALVNVKWCPGEKTTLSSQIGLIVPIWPLPLKGKISRLNSYKPMIAIISVLRSQT